MKKSHFIATTASVAVVGIAAVAIGVTTLVNKEDIVIHGEKMTSSETSDSYVYSTTSSSKVESEESIVVSSTTATTSSTTVTTISTTTAPIEIEDSSVPEEDVPEVTTVVTTTSAPIEEPIEKPVESSKVEDIAEPEPVVTTAITTTSNPVETPTENTTSGKKWSLDMEIGDITDQGYTIIGKTPVEGIPYIALDEKWETQQSVIIGYASWGSPLYYKDMTAWHAAHDENVKAQVEWFEAHNGRIN